MSGLPATTRRSRRRSPTGRRPGRPDGRQLRLEGLPRADARATSAGYDDPRADNAPTYLHADGTTGPRVRTNQIMLTRATDAGRWRSYRDRARMVQSIDRMLGRIRATVGPDTYLVLTADNGFHLGQHQLNGGKGAPYDSDSRVPLVVVGPGVVPGARQQFVNNIDLAPTFEELAGLEPAEYRSGISASRRPSPPRPRRRGTRSSSTPTPSRVPGEVDLDMGSGGTSTSSRRSSRCAAIAGLLVRFDLDESPRPHTSYAWELYRYDRPGRTSTSSPPTTPSRGPGTSCDDSSAGTTARPPSAGPPPASVVRVHRPDCPCGSGTPYDACCGVLHRGERQAATPEELMRSRYSAYALGDLGYVDRTWHPRTRPDAITPRPGLRWTGLEVHAADGEVVESPRRTTDPQGRARCTR